MKILIVEDLAFMRRLIEATLHTIGYKDNVKAENGLDALSKLAIENFDMVITDWMMPMMDGLELTKYIRASDKHKNIPILMITALSDKKDIEKAFLYKINDYIIKPFTVDILKNKIFKITSDTKLNIKNDDWIIK